ncbi:MAG: xanthine dehydrogenase accessory protein XdhC [Aquamicrobium sp.]|uniref:xanthine dehydrogenase accessory protein XdhC n=1 Tax=Aquamicrobium sp. TaxID=1872579 RepID=UPI00349E54A0|nr:xanthine dehydrogenase accessory protein XdhC [Aquamicrobium sp.]
MSAALSRLRAFLAAWPRVALVEVREAKGSTPREAGAWMLVSPGAIFGTIGGGQLEFMAIDRARDMIAAGAPAADILDVPLGPQIGQCCGGRMLVDVALAGEARRAAMLRRIEDEAASRPSVFIFGGGHVGHALAAALALLPLAVTIVETRADQIGDLPEGVEVRLTAVPEEVVRDAPPGSAFLVLTHDHALDFLIVAEALRRADAAYVGMIGSRTKRATFASWYLKEAGGGEGELSRLVCPIGGAEVKDKRPAVIAAMAAAEVMRGLSAS